MPPGTVASAVCSACCLAIAGAAAVPVEVGDATVADALDVVGESSELSEPHAPKSNADAIAIGIRIAHRTIFRSLWFLDSVNAARRFRAYVATTDLAALSGAMRILVVLPGIPCKCDDNPAQ